MNIQRVKALVDMVHKYNPEANIQTEYQWLIFEGVSYNDLSDEDKCLTGLYLEEVERNNYSCYCSIDINNSIAFEVDTNE